MSPVLTSTAGDTAPRSYAIGSAEWPGLSKFVEEAGEALQVAGKLLGTGGTTDHWDGTNLSDRFTDELGDVLAAVEFFIEVNSAELDIMRILARQEAKLTLFRKWHEEQAFIEVSS